MQMDAVSLSPECSNDSVSPAPVTVLFFVINPLLVSNEKTRSRTKFGRSMTIPDKTTVCLRSLENFRRMENASLSVP